MKAFVTGATGFIGTHLIDRLRERGAEICCLVRSQAQAARFAAQGVQTVRGDVTRPDGLREAVSDIDVVFHLAALTKAMRAADMMQVNVEGVRNVAEACAARTTPPVLVLVSSLAAAGPMTEARLREANDPPRPVSLYGRTKRAGEEVAESFADRIPLTIVRPPIVFGEGDADFYQMVWPVARFGIHMVPGWRDAKFSLVHADDLVDALWLAAERGTRVARPGADQTPCSGYYFPAFDEHPTYAELGRRIAAAVDRHKVRVLYAPGFSIWMLGLFGEVGSRLRGRPGIINLDKAREGLAGHWACNPTAAREHLGFAPRESLDARLRQTVDWYVKQKWLIGR